ncbi:MAG TPA: hypothetical protein VLF18_22675 [Tahibacter sp.]|uniref:hypothetical protein n=1 Tax=Tahibacter sp. TaxID=2056211 RepID=UPI002C487A22|nr:hypothetical protein [Tahibacter sp.]HSX63001.1 hypothetical protein [Tahibacter sp.]
MSDDIDTGQHAAEERVNTYWWCAGFGDTLIWSRLDIFASGIAEVLGATGEYLRYDDETSARMALLDADFREFDGLDEDDAAAMGFDLDTMDVPRGDSDDELLPRMVHKIARGIG